MPGILDRSEQMLSALKLTRKFGREIEDAGYSVVATSELLPGLENCHTLQDYHDFNEKCRKWIDKKRTP